MNMPKKKVLIIEDFPTFGEYLKMAIKAINDFEIEVAASLSEVVCILTDRGDDFFCATIDINLPDSEKGEAVEFVICNYPHIATIVLTGDISPGLREDLLQLQIADYVLKNGDHNIEYVAWLVDRIHRNAICKVLVVDDSRTARFQICKALESQHFITYQAKSAEAAMLQLEEHPDIRLALVDCYMEGMSGLHLTEKIRQNYRKEELCIIGISHAGGQNISAEFIKNGANDFLTKPFLPEEFNCRINQSVELLDKIAELSAANEVKNTALGTAAHDIRGPLGAIRGLPQLMKRPDLAEEKRTQYLNSIMDACNNMLDLLSNLLNMSMLETRQITLDPTLFSISKLADKQVAFFSHLSEEKNIALKFNSEVNEDVIGDSKRIRQVINNFITNAIKYSPFDSTVTINVLSTATWQRVEVIDQGCGIEDKYLNQLFNVYQRCGNQPTGGESSNGFGLVICKTLLMRTKGLLGIVKQKVGVAVSISCYPPPATHTP